MPSFVRTVIKTAVAVLIMAFRNVTVMQWKESGAVAVRPCAWCGGGGGGGQADDPADEGTRDLHIDGGGGHSSPRTRTHASLM